MKLQLEQRDVNGNTFYVAVDAPASVDSFIEEGILMMRAALEDQVQEHYEPCVCERCNKPSVPMMCARAGAERVFVCPGCYPEACGDPTFIAKIEQAA